MAKRHTSKTLWWTAGITAAIAALVGHSAMKSACRYMAIPLANGRRPRPMR